MDTPKINELRQSFISAFEDNYGTINRGLKSVFNTLSVVYAGVLRLVYLYAARVQKNVWPDLADSEVDGGTLERFGRSRLGRDPFPASQGVYLIDITGAIGGTVAASIIFKSTSGFSYSNETAFTLTGTTGQITVRSLTPGLDAQLQPGDTIVATQPILNVDEAGIVNQEIETPLNAEDIEDYRAKIEQSFRIESQGGASGDYRIWSSDAQGVREVYPYVDSPGDIDLYVEATEEDSTDGNGTPSQTILDNVEEVVNQDPDTTKSLNERGRLPLGVFNVDYLPITTIPVSVTVTGYTGNTSEAVPVIEAALKEYFYDIRPYVPGADPIDASTLYQNRLVGVVVDAVGLENNFDDLQMIINATPETVRKFIDGDIPIVGVVIVNA